MENAPKTADNDNKPPQENAVKQENNKNGLGQNKRIRLIAIIAGIILLIAGISYYIYSRHHESTDDAFIDSHVVQMSPKIAGRILKVYVKDNQTVKAGDLLVEIDPRDYEVALSQASAGWRAVMAQSEGARVNYQMTGITAVAQAEEASAAVQSARSNVKSNLAQLNAAKSKLEEAKSQVTTAFANAEAAKADTAAAQAQAVQAAADAKGAEELLKDGVISRQDKEHSVTSAQSAQAQVEALKKRAISAASLAVQSAEAEKGVLENLHQVESQYQQSQSDLSKAEGFYTESNVASQKLAVSKSSLEAAVGGIDYLKAGIQKAELDLSYTKIYAPTAGRVTRKAVEIGDYVQVGQPLMAIVPHEIWVTANFKETQLTRMRPGLKVNIKVDAYPGKVFKGHIDSIQSGTGSHFSLLPPENATGNYVKVVQRVPVKIVFDEPPDSKYILAPGMSVTPDVELQ